MCVCALPDHSVKGKGDKQANTVKLAKMPALPDYQFFNVTRLTEVRGLTPCTRLHLYTNCLALLS